MGKKGQKEGTGGNLCRKSMPKPKLWETEVPFFIQKWQKTVGFLKTVGFFMLWDKNNITLTPSPSPPISLSVNGVAGVLPLGLFACVGPSLPLAGWPLRSMTRTSGWASSETVAGATCCW